MKKADNILDAIWYGSLNPHADIALDGELGEFYSNNVLVNEENLLKTFTSDQMKLFEIYIDSMKTWHDEVEKENFKAGAKMCFEIIKNIV